MRKTSPGADESNEVRAGLRYLLSVTGIDVDSMCDHDTGNYSVLCDGWQCQPALVGGTTGAASFCKTSHNWRISTFLDKLKGNFDSARSVTYHRTSQSKAPCAQYFRVA